MKDGPSRRDFLKASASSLLVTTGASLSASLSSASAEAAPAAPLRLKKGILIDMLPTNLSYADRFKMARDAGFEVVQALTVWDPKLVEEIRCASEQAGLPIDSVEGLHQWEYPLSSSNPTVVEKGLEAMRTSLHNAKLWGAGAVLLVPAVLTRRTGYREAWTRSQRQVRKLIPLAEQLKVVIAIEECGVWNKFLLSPLEMARYLDEFQSPWVQAWFDTGNVVLGGFPEDWIRTLGQRINRLHVKDFKVSLGGQFSSNCCNWANIGEGSVDWPAVRGALAAISFKGSATCELPPGNEDYLRDVSHRVDKFVLGA
jgi:L-ribulose-5-phosphate 3-epimerase